MIGKGNGMTKKTASLYSTRLPHPFDVKLGIRIRYCRKQARLSQQEVARICGISFQQIQKYENGMNRISFSRLMEIADACNMEVMDILAPILPTKEGRAKVVDHFDLMNDAQAIELLSSFKNVASGDRKIILELASSLSVHAQSHN